MYKWLLFDVDGTLFDFDKAESKALQNAFKQFGLNHSESVAKIYREINAQIWLELERGEIAPQALGSTRFQRLFDAIKQQADASQFNATYQHQLGMCSQLIDDAESLLQQLSQTHQLAIITNGLSNVQRPRLAASPITPYFESVTISDEVGVAKPNGRIFDIAFASMGNPAKSDVLIIGDSLSSDMQGGINYGIDTCWFNDNSKQRSNGLPITYEINQLADLARIL
ncbi:MAG: noncanonical pyrimidine nucleotidase, YjjG family [Chloroflexi bacterium]|nr:noncanonical pyrimidine nucleotidase, YjjG family [Chloroflexota bacterium]